MTAPARAPLAAPVVAVTVLEDRASVRRRGAAALPPGLHGLVIEGVAPVLVDKSLVATAVGARVIDARCERYLAPWRDPDAGGAPAEPAALRAEQVELARARAAATSRADVARAEIAALGDLAAAALRELAESATRGVAPAGAAEALAALDADAAAAGARAAAAALEVARLDEVLGRLAARLARAEAEAGAEGARLVIDLDVDGGVTDGAAEAGAPRPVEVAVQYLVPGAAWRPYHRAALVGDGDGAGAAARVDWEVTACVWQATGEDWPDVALTCSLERPSLGVEPPPVVDDELATQRRAEVLAVEVREQELQTAGLGSGAAEVPGIDDGGLGVLLEAPRATIRADGSPHRVPLGAFTAPARVERVAIPLRSPWVHVRAELTNTGAQPLLAGPVDLVRSAGYAGRAEIGFVAPGEVLELGFGPDAELRVHRAEARTTEDGGLTGGTTTRVRVAVRLSSLGTAPRTVAVTERVPISEVEQVEIAVAPPEAYVLGPDDEPFGEQIAQVTARAIDERGLVRWVVELPAHARRAVALEYRVRARRGVTGA